MKKRRIPITDIPYIRPGDELYYVAGTGEHHCEAHVTVESVGTTGSTVRIKEIRMKGEQATQEEGQVIIAGNNELKITIFNEVLGT
jgi:hypothetical protein